MIEPQRELDTHTVENQVPFFPSIDLYTMDLPLRESVQREGGGSEEERLSKFGSVLGSETYRDHGRLANVHAPTFHPFDRFGHRIDEVRFHPSYHSLMGLAKESGIHSLAWTLPKGGHVVHSAMKYLLTQVEAGCCCPLTMTYAVAPTLEGHGAWADEVRTKVLSNEYDPRFLPISEKKGITMGMAMTEKQGGSDVRANSSQATLLEGEQYHLRGHKWFCSAPMSDAFLTLAYTEKGLTCFFVPRVTPEGKRNRLRIQRLKDKLGNRSNASAEIEYDRTWARRIGEEGRGVPTIIEMVHHTRLDCAVAAVGLQRRALTEALHHARHRKAFGRYLIDQPLMQNVLADLCIEYEANLMMVFRVARAYDEKDTLFARLAVAIAKYWSNKRCAYFVNEAMECLGGAGYIEESILPRLYREAPLNGIWEGSGNVICLDILRTIHKAPDAFASLWSEIEKARGVSSILDRELDALQNDLKSREDMVFQARRIVERLALALQASLIARFGTKALFHAFVETRIRAGGGRAFGTLPLGVDISSILKRLEW